MVPSAKADGSEMLCRMPAVQLPRKLGEQFNKMIDGTDGPGVAVYRASNGIVRADIYIGFKLNGFKLYENISSVNSDLKMQFSPKPTLSCINNDIDFEPHKDKLISNSIKVNRSAAVTRHANH